jgi:TonB family protein
VFLHRFARITKVMLKKNFRYPPARCSRKISESTWDKGGSVSFKVLNRTVAVGLLLLGGWVAASSSLAWGQQEITRKVKTRVAPVYPELAKRMSLSGVVRIEVTVTSKGDVKNTKLVGGHPLLAGAALDAVKKWRFEAGPEESVGIVEFHFDPTQ